MASDSEQKLSRIEQWRKKKAEEKKAKNKAYYEKNKQSIIKENSDRRDSRKSPTTATQRKSSQHAKVKEITKNKARAQKQKDALEKEEKRKALQRERAKRYRLKKKSSNAQEEESGLSTSPEKEKFPNRMAKKRALDKAKKAWPSTPSKKASLLLEMSNSPRTRKILVKKGAMRTPEDEKEVMALKAIAQDLSEELSAIKSARSNSRRAAYTAAKPLAFGESMKKKRSKKTVSKLVT